MKYRRKKVQIMYSPGLEQKMVELPIYTFMSATKKWWAHTRGRIMYDVILYGGPIPEVE